MKHPFAQAHKKADALPEDHPKRRRDTLPGKVSRGGRSGDISVKKWDTLPG